jgi:hypothetical protein
MGSTMDGWKEEEVGLSRVRKEWEPGRTGKGAIYVIESVVGLGGLRGQQ